MLYLHIPLCTSKCHYCDFYSVAARGVDRLAIVKKMSEEISLRQGELADPLSSIYFGGGTPSLLLVDEVQGLIQKAESTFGLGQNCEITLEANPEQLTMEYLKGLRQAKINRLSIGIQSFNDDRLKNIGRRHSALQAIQAVEMAQKVGFDNISIDLMFGFFDMTLNEWQDQLNQAFALKIQHFSAYQLSIEPRTVFGRRGVETASDETSAAQYELLCQTARQAGFEHYEISNFALSGRRSRHNGGYWVGRPYLGIGAAAHSYDGDRKRSWNVSSVRDYLNGGSAEDEFLNDEDLHNEFIMTRLRTSEGFSVEEYQRKFNGQLHKVDGLEIEADRAYISERNLFVADSIIANLFI